MVVINCDAKRIITLFYQANKDRIENDPVEA